MKELFRYSTTDAGLKFSIAENEFGNLLFTDHLRRVAVALPHTAERPLYALLAERGVDHPASPADPAEGPAKPNPAHTIRVSGDYVIQDPFVSSEVETPAPPRESGIATDPFDVMKTALMDACPALAAIAPMEDIDQLTAAACAAYGRHQTGEAYGLPPYEPPACGTRHLLAERFLRLLDKGTPFDALPSGENWAVLSEAVDDAGVAFAREALVRDAKPHLDDEDLPF